MDVYNKQDKFIAHELTYSIKHVERDGGNVADQEISLDFDKMGHLYQIIFNAMTPVCGKIRKAYTEPETGVKFYITTPPQKE